MRGAVAATRVHGAAYRAVASEMATPAMYTFAKQIVPAARVAAPGPEDVINHVKSFVQTTAPGTVASRVCKHATHRWPPEATHDDHIRPRIRMFAVVMVVRPCNVTST